jgi:hypothetical protein
MLNSHLSAGFSVSFSVQISSTPLLAIVISVHAIRENTSPEHTIFASIADFRIKRILLACYTDPKLAPSF